MKNLVIKIAGASPEHSIKDITIAPGTTAGEILKRLDLNGFTLTKGSDSTPFTSDQNMYTAAESGEKLFAISPAEVAEVAFGPPPAPQAVTTIFVGHQPVRTLILPDGSPEWKLRGWMQDGNDCKGFYKTKYGLFKGEARREHNGELKFYIIDPPKELRNHPHWICFNHIWGARFSVHFSPQITDLDSGIMRIEAVINESFRRYC